MRTRVFKSGNSQAVRIPKALQFPPGVEEVELEVVPGGFFIRNRVEPTLKLSEILAAFGAEFMPEGRVEAGEEPERPWPWQTAPESVLREEKA